MKSVILLLSCWILAGSALAQQSFDQETIDIGNMGVQVTNVGTLGRPNVRSDPQGPPSMEYPINTGIEHLFETGLWIGAKVAGQTLVSTGARDAAGGYSTGAPGFEFSAEVGSQIDRRSSLSNSDFFAFDAISHQDMLSDFSDKNVVVPGTSITISGHDQPLGAQVHLETYAWNYSFADFFVILNYEVTNEGTDTWDSVFLGMWQDLVVRNVNVSTDFGSAFFSQGGYGYVDSFYANYAFDNRGDPGFTDSYGAVQLLGVEWRDVFIHPDNAGLVIDSGYPEPKAHSNFWIFNSTGAPPYNAPANDVEAYAKMKKGLNYGDPGVTSFLVDPGTTGGLTNVISVGPLVSVEPGETFNMVFGLVCAHQDAPSGSAGSDRDTETARLELLEHLGWARRTYYGEDLNGNGLLDEGEDLNDNGLLDRYILPEPPSTPRLHVESSANRIDLYWDERAESSIDPISKRMDFEGYRLYRSQVGDDRNLNLIGDASLIAQWDNPGNDVGFNNGFDAVRLSQPLYFDGDTTAYWYHYELDQLLNGWQYMVILTAFDEGDEALGIGSLESSFVENAWRVFPGTAASDGSDEELEVGVYPNPYYVNAAWDGTTNTTRKLIFYNLPPRCRITVYSLAGDLITQLDHDGSSYNGSDAQWFDNFAGDPNQRVFSGGEHAWDVLSESKQTITQGLYVFSVENLDTEEVSIGRFSVLR